MFILMKILINYRHFNSSLSCRNCLWYLFVKTKIWTGSFMCLYLENLPAGYMPKTQDSTWQQKVYLIAGKSPSQMEMMKVQLFQGTARWVLLGKGIHFMTHIINMVWPHRFLWGWEALSALCLKLEPWVHYEWNHWGLCRDRVHSPSVEIRLDPKTKLVIDCLAKLVLLIETAALMYDVTTL